MSSSMHLCRLYLYYCASFGSVEVDWTQPAPTVHYQSFLHVCANDIVSVYYP